ncbi:type IV pilus biogenesis protein PilM [Brevibacillus sp. SYSU BS000544]|uniref:type IV pilus biogenesis protein PilM n=1 Tax=Brevibacillus sp. SYSU BS000544 TaxID=3416443 RepID=UPI003CE536E5
MKLRLPFSSKKTHIGLAIDDQGIRYSELVLGTDGIRMEQMGIIQVDNGLIESGKIVKQEELELQLALAKKDLRMRKKKAVLAVPSSFVVIRKLTLPKLSPNEVRPILEIELETTVHLPFSRPYFDYIKLREILPNKTNSQLAEFGEAEAEPMDEYLIIAAPGDVIDQYVRMMKLVDVTVTAVEIEPLALYRLLEGSGSVIPTDFMFMQLGLHSVNVSIFQGEIPEFLRNIPIDITNYVVGVDTKEWRAEDFYHHLNASGMYDSFANDLLRELDRVINFYQFSMKNDGTRIKQIYITGEFPTMERFLPHINNRLSGIETLLFPTHHIACKDSQVDNLQAFTVAAGLSLRG